MSSYTESKIDKSSLEIVFEGKIKRKKLEIDSLSQEIENMKIRLIEGKEHLAEVTSNTLDLELAKPLEEQNETEIINLTYEIGDDQTSLMDLEDDINQKIICLEDHKKRLDHLEKVLFNHVLSRIKPALPSSNNLDDDD